MMFMKLINPEAYWQGDATSSGLIGLAYKALTSAFAGTNPKADTQRINYDPIFTSMYKQGLTNATFSLAIERGSAGGYIAFGGLPPVSFTQSFTSTPIQTLSISGSSQYTFRRRLQPSSARRFPRLG